MKYFLRITVLLLTLCLVHASASHAQEIENQNKILERNYVNPTFKNFSQLYWALDRLDIENDQYLTNYLLINQCEVYQEYSHNEFHWGNIKNFAAEYLKENQKKFPIRFRFVQPLRLGQYDFDKNAFELENKFKIDGVRRFEIEAIDARKDVCGVRERSDIEGYPRGILVELSRPVIFTHMPMDVAMADAYIQEKSVEFKEIPIRRRQHTNVYNFRDIYLVFKVRFFGASGWHYSKISKKQMPRLSGVLEIMEVYDDPELTTLLYTKDFRRQKRKIGSSELKQLQRNNIADQPSTTSVNPDNHKHPDATTDKAQP